MHRVPHTARNATYQQFRIDTLNESQIKQIMSFPKEAQALMGKYETMVKSIISCGASSQGELRSNFEQFKSCLIKYISHQISQHKMLKELRPSPEKEVQDTVLSSLKRDASLQKSLCKVSSHSEKKLSTLEQRLSKLNRVYKQEKFHEKEYINKLKLKDIKISNLSSMVKDLKAQLKELEKQHEFREQEQKEIEQAQLKRKKRQNALHQKRRSQELEVKSNRLEDLESSARINKQNAELQAEKQSLTITLEACQSESRKQAEIIQNLKRELKSLKQQNITHLKTQAECQKEMTSYKLTENMLKSQLAELKKEKKLWETTKNTDCDQTNLKVTLTDPFFQIGSDHAFFVGHPSRSKSFMMNDIGSGGLK